MSIIQQLNATAKEKLTIRNDSIIIVTENKDKWNMEKTENAGWSDETNLFPNEK